MKPFEEKWWWTWWGGWWGRHRGRWPRSRQPCHSTGFPGHQKSQKYQVFEGKDLDEAKEDDDPGSQKAKSERPGWSSELRGVNAHRIALWWWWSSWVWVIWTWRWWQWCWWLSWRWRRRRWWWWWPCRIPPGEHFSSKTGRNWKSEGRLGCQRAWKAKWKLKLFWKEKRKKQKWMRIRIATLRIKTCQSCPRHQELDRNRWHLWRCKAPLCCSLRSPWYHLKKPLYLIVGQSGKISFSFLYVAFEKPL